MIRRVANGGGQGRPVRVSGRVYERRPVSPHRPGICWPGSGGPFNSTQVLPTWAFQVGINSGSLGEGAAISLYLFPFLVVVTVLMLFFARRLQVS